MEKETTEERKSLGDLLRRTIAMEKELAIHTTTSTAKGATRMDALVKEKLKSELRRRHAGTTGGEELSSPATPLIAEYTPPESAPKKKVAVSLVEGQVLASTLLGFDVRPDFAVDVLKNTDIPEEIRMFVPAVSKSYCPQPRESVQMLRALQAGDKVLISGPTGSGKSSLVEYLCALTGRPMMRLNMNGDVESANIFGQLTARDGGTVWKDGLATEAVRYGGVLVNDEWDVTPPEIMFGYQWLMEDNGKLLLKEMPGSAEEKLITPHKEFRFVCLGNTLGQGDDSGKYAGTNVQNTATLDRFQTTITLGYLSNEHEVEVIQKGVKDLSKAIITDMIKVTNLIRQGYTEGQLALSVSPRTLLNWGRKIVEWDGDVRVAFDLAYLNKLSETEKGAAVALLKRVFG